MQARISGKGASIAGVVAILALLSLGLQYVVLIANVRDTVGMPAGTVAFLGSYTILANLLVAAVAFVAALRPAGTGWLSRAGVRGAAAVYIGVAMVVYDRVLPAQRDPPGAQLWADVGLHYLVPIAYLTWWLWFAPHGALRMRAVAWWLVFPAAFLGWTIARGTWTHAWPYPFLDVDALGIAAVARNSLAVLGVMFAVGASVFGVDRGLAAPRADATR